MLLAALVSAVMLSYASSSSLEHGVAHCYASFPYIFPVQYLHIQGNDRAGPLCAANPIGTTQA